MNNENIEKWLCSVKKQTTDNEYALIKRAVKILEGNEYADSNAPWGERHCLLPDYDSFKGIWNWDTAFHSMGVSRFDTDFAIENIDTAFNPKLCREVTRRLIELARKHDKQIIATTHNAAVLDGMNLFEDDVRLHIVRRSIDGYTKSNRVTLKSEMSMPLSEAWVKGFIGGLPDNF